jgi:hypothetical protein
MFDNAAQLCSLSSGPGISNVLQVLEDLEYGLTIYRNDINKPVVTRVAAQSAIKLAGLLRSRRIRCGFFAMSICK